MLATLLETPQTPEQWERWSFAHRVSHDAIRDGVAAQGGQVLSDYVIFPLAQENFGQFLQANQMLHIDMGRSLGLLSSDLEEVDPSDKEALAAWNQLHYQQHYDAERRLGVAS